MTIRIGFDGDDESPTGTVFAERAQVPFVGWLDLMQALSRLGVRAAAPDVAGSAPAEEQET